MADTNTSGSAPRPGPPSGGNKASDASNSGTVASRKPWEVDPLEALNAHRKGRDDQRTKVARQLTVPLGALIELATDTVNGDYKDDPDGSKRLNRLNNAAQALLDQNEATAQLPDDVRELVEALNRLEGDARTAAINGARRIADGDTKVLPDGTPEVNSQVAALNERVRQLEDEVVAPIAEAAGAAATDLSDERNRTGLVNAVKARMDAVSDGTVQSDLHDKATKVAEALNKATPIATSRIKGLAHGVPKNTVALTFNQDDGFDKLKANAKELEEGLKPADSSTTPTPAS